VSSEQFPDLGESCECLGLQGRDRTSDGRFLAGRDGVHAIGATRDGKVEFVGFDSHTLALVKSSMGYPAYYPVPAVRIDRPVRALLMDLDGTGQVVINLVSTQPISWPRPLSPPAGQTRQAAASCPERSFHHPPEACRADQG
jgi:hypothetical protein